MQRRQFHRTIALLLLLVTAQQGALVHELSHLSRPGSAGARTETSVAAERACALCASYAQIGNAASPAVHVPAIVRARPELNAEPYLALIAAEVPRPRSRGPPTFS